jgi:glycosyltransferase involved in cell wall biosynthesis
MGGMSLGLIEAVRRSGTPAVGVVIDDWMVYGPKVDAWQRACSRLGPLHGVAERLAGVPAVVDLDGAGRWLFVSDAARAGARRTGLELPDSAVVHGGVDHELFTPAPERDWEWRLLYVGRIDPRKGLTVAVRALSELPQASLTIAGDGDRRHLSELRALAAREGVLDRIAFERPPRPELPSVYAASDALLFPVLWEEPWGIVPLEAMAVGRPVVATGTGGSAEYLSDGENCLVYRPRDEPAGLAAAVRRLAEDPGLRGRLRRGGLETAAGFTETAFNQAVADATLAGAPAA